MSRVMSQDLLAALSAPATEPFYAVEMLFDTAPIRVWTGYGKRMINGQEFTGGGSVLGVEGLQEAADLTATSATITLSGVSSEIIALALAEPYQRRACRVWFGERSVSEVVLMFSGLMNTMTIKDSGETSTIALLVDSKLVELQRTRDRRYTQESHLARYPADNFFSLVADIQDKSVVWSKAK